MSWAIKFKQNEQLPEMTYRNDYADEAAANTDTTFLLASGYWFCTDPTCLIQHTLFSVRSEEST